MNQNTNRNAQTRVTWSNIRLSRLTHPRASMITVLLLTAAFTAFGALTSTLRPDLVTEPGNPEEATETLLSWMACP